MLVALLRRIFKLKSLKLKVPVHKLMKSTMTLAGGVEVGGMDGWVCFVVMLERENSMGVFLWE